MDTIVRNLEQAISAALSGLREELGGVRTSRASSLLVENIIVDAYDQKLPLKAVGAISVFPPRQISVQVWDPAVVAATAKTIEAAIPGVSVNIEGAVIYINLPALTAERRQELGKLAGRMTEERKIMFRRLRDEANKKASELKVEDEKYRAKEKIQTAIDKINKEADEMLRAKVEEISL